VAKIQRTSAQPRCCVVDRGGKVFACYPTEREAAVAREILSKSPLGVACRVQRFGKAKQRRRGRKRSHGGA
jgi:hypothetical protein